MIYKPEPKDPLPIAGADGVSICEGAVGDSAQAATTARVRAASRTRIDFMGETSARG